MNSLTHHLKDQMDRFHTLISIGLHSHIHIHIQISIFLDLLISLILIVSIIHNSRDQIVSQSSKLNLKLNLKL